eukprot:TRINITY_DN85710_c0_g1_i1.p1 TRINITY_DN85710_c0_g1~~TRINITY_DN85710_c0_g1_i1.p1  ORF type:complete len:476 (+),score=299.55 TRINITY_DN85710_c0_g1_i1:131-1429(+)
MHSIFEAFVTILMGVSKDELRQPAFGAMENFQFPEIHEDSIPQFNLSSKIMELLIAVGVHDCSLRDIVEPTYARTKRILSALINFAKFREERLGKYQEFTEKSDQLVDLHQQLDHQNAQLQNQLEQLQAKREAEMPRIEALTTETDELTEEIDRLNVRHAALREEVRQVKNESNEFGDRIATNKFHLLNAKQENDQLKSQIVKNPEKLKASLARMQEAVSENKKELMELSAKLREYNTRFEALGRVDEKVRARTKNVEECQADLAKCRALMKEIKDAVATTQANEENIAELTSTEQHLLKQINAGQDNLYRLQRQFEQKRHATQMALDQVTHDKMMLLRSQAKDKSQIEANRTLYEVKMQEIQSARQQHEEAMNVAREQYQKLAARISTWHDTMLAAIHNTGTAPGEILFAPTTPARAKRASLKLAQAMHNI